MSPDPDDLNVESEADYFRFAEKAEKVYSLFREQQALILELLDRGEDAWSSWEFEFLESLHAELKAQEASGKMHGLNPAQLRKLDDLC